MTGILFGGEDAPGVAGTERFADEDRGMQSRKFFEIFREHARLIASIAICGTLAVGGVALFLPPRYTARAQVVVEPPRAQSVDERVPSAEPGPDQPAIQTEVAALLSHDLLATVVAQLNVDPTFRSIRSGAPRSAADLPATGKNILDIEELERHLKVFQEAGSQVITVAYTSRDPAEAAAIANRITEYYLAAGEERSRLAPDQAISDLARKIVDLRAESQSREAAVAAYQAAHGVKDAAKTNVIDQNLGDLDHQLSAAQAELAARRTRYAELSASRGATGTWEPLLAGLDAPGLVDLHDQALAVLAGRQDNIAVVPHSEERSHQGPAAPQRLRDRVTKELNQTLVKLSHEERVAAAQVAAIEARLSAVQRASDDVQLHDLVVAAAAARHRYQRLVQRRDELLEQGDDVTAPARLLSRAAVPDRPSSLNPLLFLAPGGVAFLMIGCLVALLRDRLDQGIYSENDVASVLGVRCAGFLPLSQHLIPTEGTTGPFTEGLCGILVSLQLVGARGRRPRVILVTSSVPGEGKTTLAGGLAACAARTGAKVLLLDLDARAEAAISLAAGDSPREQIAGELIDSLARDRAMIEVIRPGPGMELDYLPLRRRPSAEPSPLISDDRMSRLLKRQRSSYDLIFIDSAPVLARADVRLLAAIADEVVLAVRWGKTRRDEARAALALLHGSGPNGADLTARISAAITQVDLGRCSRSVRAGALAKYGEYFWG